MRKSVNIGIIGYGVVGKGTVAALVDNAVTIQLKTGISIKIKGIADRSIHKKMDNYLKNIDILTTDPYELIRLDEIDIIVELIGGYTTAKDIVTAAIKNNKHIVTANKALLALFGEEIYQLAEKHNVDIGYEASVGGGIPVIRMMKEDLTVNNIQEIHSIINGTANYILSEMSRNGSSFDEVLQEAKDLGYAEADPTFDIEGIDSAHKITILASIAFSFAVPFNKVFIEGISNIKPIDIEIAKEFNYILKLLAVAKCDGINVEIRVHPTMIPANNVLAKVDGVFNAVYIKSDKTGATLHYGKGAGMDTTGAAVAGDIINISKNICNNYNKRVSILGYQQDKGRELNIIDIKDIRSAFYMRLMVEDSPGVLAQVGFILAENNISVSSAIQKGASSDTNFVPLVFMTHETIGKNIINAVQKIDSKSFVKEKTMVIRVEGD